MHVLQIRTNNCNKCNTYVVTIATQRPSHSPHITPKFDCFDRNIKPNYEAFRSYAYCLSADLVLLTLLAKDIFIKKIYYWFSSAELGRYKRTKSRIVL